MQTIQVRDAKAQFSQLVAAAERGEPTTITRHGQPAAVIVPVAMAKRLYPDQRRSFSDVLLDYPGGIEFEREPLGISVANPFEPAFLAAG